MDDELHSAEYYAILREIAVAQRAYQADRWIEALLGARLRFHDDYRQDTLTYDRWRELYRTAY